MAATLDLPAIARATKYPLDAFVFVQRGLDFTVRRVHGDPPDKDSDQSSDAPESIDAKDEKVAAVFEKAAELVDNTNDSDTSRHVGGAALCWGLRDYALRQYGLMARTVLRYWHINSTEDFGHIVYAMVEAGMMRKTDDDTLRDFHGVFDFTESFNGDLILK